MKNKGLTTFNIRSQKQVKANKPTESGQRTWADDSQNIMYQYTMQFTEKKKKQTKNTNGDQSYTNLQLYQ